MSGASRAYIRYLPPGRFAAEPGRGQFGREMDGAVTNHGAGESDHHHQYNFPTHMPRLHAELPKGCDHCHKMVEWVGPLGLWDAPGHKSPHSPKP
jgi:hypothetical protein